jgi:hypothetical protein
VKSIFKRLVLPGDLLILISLAALKLLILLLAINNYGFHRDEFLYIAQGEHLAWGYLEVPPFIAVVAKISRILFGDVLWGFRFFPVLTGSAMVIITGLMTRELGGRRWAMILAAVCTVFAPASLGSNFMLQPVAFDQLFWALAIFCLVMILKNDRWKFWIWLGVICGIGLLNKYTMLLLGFGVFLGILISPQRKLLAGKWPWLAAALAFLIFLPNLLWQVQHHWPFFEHMEVLRKTQLVNIQAFSFILMQILMNFWAFPVALLGWLFLMFSTKNKPHRSLGWMVLIVFAVIFGMSGKPYYLLPIYPLLFAAGSVGLENYFANRRKRWITIIITIFIALGNIITFPYAIPILPVEDFKSFANFMKEKLDLTEPLRWEDGRLHDNKQDYADMFGWEEQSMELATVFLSLPSAEQHECVIFTANYGEAAALDFYRSRYHLPPVISYAGSYYLWKPREIEPSVYLTIGLSSEDIQSFFAEIRLVKFITHPLARENNIPLLLCCRPRLTLTQLWPELAKYRY